ncbi:MAG TPA: hypothetical protein DEB39_11710 [Planctomycetaceae bacterium]|nr:hypothetical protein [Planctomycetaceae bacterium]
MKKTPKAKCAFPPKCVVDTNVPKISNLAVDLDGIEKELMNVVEEAARAVEWFTEQTGVLILDEQEEIFEEYLNQLNSSGQPGLGDAFMKWVCAHRFTDGKCERVPINKDRREKTYDEFPIHEGLKDFDPSDRKFVAVANAHPEKPPILEGTDSKWWGWKDALADVGIAVVFLDEKYVKTKYGKKLGE